MFSNRRLVELSLRTVFATAFAATPATAAQTLGHYGLDPAVAVAGASSGGAMAVQLHVAHSRTFSRGAAVIAGVPYDCARGSAIMASSRCMKGWPIAPDPRESIRLTLARARSGDVDAIDGLGGSRVYLFSGTRDDVVRPAVMETLYRYYRRFIGPAAILFDRDVPASHAWISPGSARSCDATGSPFINDCGIDVPGRLLEWLFGPLSPKRGTESLRGRLLAFDQREFVVRPNSAAESGFDESGWLYVPDDCDPGKACRLLVALHGCRQGRRYVDDAFVRQAGLNEWADSNRIVVLYPQAVSTRSNPRGCWDWWGFTNADYATKSGVQIHAINAMVARLVTDTGRRR